MPKFFLTRFFGRQISSFSGSEMLIDAMRIVARETGFTIVDHAFGFTALREDDNGHLLFCLSTGEWSIYNGRTAQSVANGHGLASFLVAASRYFDLPSETAEAVQK
ncbi:MAG: hypothetical protein JO213_21130, partial [Alphaproteobacteria bacterium]|nr:hypothetical protein [Alphaproteobacteria bacterium]